MCLCTKHTIQAHINICNAQPVVTVHLYITVQTCVHIYAPTQAPAHTTTFMCMQESWWGGGRGCFLLPFCFPLSPCPCRRPFSTGDQPVCCGEPGVLHFPHSEQAQSWTLPALCFRKLGLLLFLSRELTPAQALYQGWSENRTNLSLRLLREGPKMVSKLGWGGAFQHLSQNSLHCMYLPLFCGPCLLPPSEPTLIAQATHPRA